MISLCGSKSDVESFELLVCFAVLWEVETYPLLTEKKQEGKKRKRKMKALTNYHYGFQTCEKWV